MSPPNSEKRVCGRCNREFANGRALGGHVKTHYRERRKTRFTRRKRSTKRTSLDLLRSYLYPIKKNTTTTQQQQQQEVGRGVRGGGPDRDDHGRGRGDGSGEIVDLTKSLPGVGWQVRRKRGSNAVKTTWEVSHPNYDYHYDYDEDEDDDEDDDEDEDGFTVMERLRRCGITGNAHRISRTRRLYVCKTCSVHLPTFHAVLVHVNDCRCSSDSSDSIEVYEVPPAVGEEEGGAEEQQQQQQQEAEAEAEASMEVVDDLEEEEGEQEDEEMGDDEGEEGDDEGMSSETLSEVYQVIDVEEEEEVIMEEELAAAEDAVRVNARAADEGSENSTSSMDEEVAAPVPPKGLNFDLNEMPPKED